MKTSIHLIVFLIATFHINLTAQNWKAITTVEDVCEVYPEKMYEMLSAFNLNYPGLEKVKKAHADGLLVEACKLLLDYYKKSDSGVHLRRELPAPSSASIAMADTILKNVFVVQNVRGQVPWREDGHRDWYYKGPNKDREWAWLSNRHSQVNQVLEAYFDTGNPNYAEYIDLLLRDFIIASMPYPGVKSSTSVWRGLEVAARAKVWPKVFFGLQKSEFLSPATRLFILSSLPDHAHYNRNFHSQNNWLTMEISALATVAADFPEYEKSPEWLKYAVNTISESMKGQVYPDGTQTELTSHYHNVARYNFVLFKEICDRANHPLPSFFETTIEKMYAYTAHTIRPDGHGLLNNDGDLDENVDRVLKGAKAYNHPDWAYIATNGSKGVKPAEGPSWFYPWAGHLISRSGYDRDAHWSFFDVGPWGSGHQHNDKLHLSVSAYGRDLLVDAGRFAYTGEIAEKFRGYARGSQGHNVLLIDGQGQSPGPKLAESPVPENQWKITDEYDYAFSSFDEFIDVDGEIEHNRTLYYQRGEFWVVVDRVTTDRPRQVEALWHWHPDCNVMVESDRVRTEHAMGNLQIIPVGGQKWDIKLVKGQEDPELQGWYSEEYNKYEPNPTAVYSTRIENTATFVWVLYPSEKPVKEVRAELIEQKIDKIKVRLQVSGKTELVVTVPLLDYIYEHD